MFKNIIIYVLAVVLLPFVSGCTKSGPAENVVTCSFTASLDSDIQTKAAGDGSLVNQCIMELFIGGESVGQYVGPVVGGRVAFAVPVVMNSTYTAAFWAQTTGKYGTSSLKAVTVPPVSGADADAFCAVKNDINVETSSFTVDVTLKRPFGMMTITPRPDSVRYTAQSVYNVLTDVMSAPQEYLLVKDSTFFILASPEKILKTIFINGNKCDGVPVRRNYKTNITLTNN